MALLEIIELQGTVTYLKSFIIPNLEDRLTTYTDRDIKQRKKITELELTIKQLTKTKTMKTNMENREKLTQIIRDEIIGEELWNDNMNMNDDEIVNLTFDIVEQILMKFELNKIK